MFIFRFGLGDVIMSKKFAALLVAMAFSTNSANAFPDRTVILVVPFAAGGPADVIGRSLADALSKKMNQRVIVENVTGAGGTVGSARVSNASGDGHTILLGHIGTHGAAPALYRKLSYDPASDFKPVGMVGYTPMVLLAKPVAGKGLKTFREYASSRGEKLSFSHGGVGSISHLGCVLLNHELGLKATAVGYRGNGPALQDLLGSQVDYMCDAVSTARPYIESGALAGVMMLSESGDGDASLASSPKSEGARIDVTAWYALFLPKSADEKVVAQVAEFLDAALDAAQLKESLAKTGTNIADKSQRNPLFVSTHVGSEVAKWKGILEPTD